MLRGATLQRLASETFDLVVIGAGIYGVAVAWKASQSGLRVALLDRGDFGAATSANSLRTIHGGLRYLQHLDLARMRQSIRARREWLQLYPEQVRPVQCALPTFGHGLLGREVLTLALLANDVIGADRNRGVPERQHLGWGTTCGRARAHTLFGETALADYTGAAFWYDGLCLDSERVLIDLVLRAENCGAVAINYFRVDRIEVVGGSVRGVVGTDLLSAAAFEVSAPCVVNAAGPWIDDVLGRSAVRYDEPLYRPSRAFNLLTRRLPFEQAVGIPIPREGHETDAVVDKGTDTCFVMPWGRYSLIGTRHLKDRAGADQRLVSDDEVRHFIRDLNGRLGRHALADEDVFGIYAGQLPESPRAGEDPHVVLEKTGRIIDHAQWGIGGLWSLIGVKWTTALKAAEGVVAAVLARAGDRGRAKREAPEVAAGAGGRSTIATATGSIADRVHAAVAHEHAVALEDVIMRRTQLYLEPDFDESALAHCASLMARELSWSDAEVAANIAGARASYDRFRWHGTLRAGTGTLRSWA